MDAKQYLRQVRRLDDIVNAKLEQVTELRSLAAKMTSTPRLDAAQPSGGNQDKLSSAVAKIVDLESEINDTVDEYIDLKREVTQQIDSMENDDYKLLLTLRYLNYWTWEKIAVEMNYTYRNVLYIHGRALQEIESVNIA